MCPPSSDAERARGPPPASSASSCESHERAPWCCERRRPAPVRCRRRRDIRSCRRSCAPRTARRRACRPGACPRASAPGPARRPSRFVAVLHEEVLEAILGPAPPRPAFDRNEARDGVASARPHSLPVSVLEIGRLRQGVHPATGSAPHDRASRRATLPRETRDSGDPERQRPPSRRARISGRCHASPTRPTASARRRQRRVGPNGYIVVSDSAHKRCASGRRTWPCLAERDEQGFRRFKTPREPD